MNLEWSLLAIEDRDRIFDYIVQDDPEAAVRLDESIAAGPGMLNRGCILP